MQVNGIIIVPTNQKGLNMTAKSEAMYRKLATAELKAQLESCNAQIKELYEYRLVRTRSFNLSLQTVSKQYQLQTAWRNARAIEAELSRRNG